jgi:endonuclease/exonuclease/phosphatase family metal-dependent hydrolase
MSGAGSRLVTVNLGGAGPTASEYRASTRTWAEEHVDAYDVVLAQEVPDDDWIRIWTERGFQQFTSTGPAYRARSVVLVRNGITARGLLASEFPTSAYHGSYVAAAVVELPGVGAVVLMSVHASPNRVSEEWAEQWRGCHQELPEGRPSCGLWDSDLVLRSLEIVAVPGVPVIAAGDWNEARAWDLDHPGTAGKEFFAKVRDAGLTDCCCPADRGVEGAGDGWPTHGKLCIDHVVATVTVAPHVAVRTPTTPQVAGPSDHRAVEFTIAASGGV